ncbi:DUF4229 domain-containing protein [Paractinoplanes rhizophilus]|uniref:DUF4229 domain-containing protein n=1 Tax=Paractinoplanes rhizophilus TaxID=1416877 RepID=A0ABW2HNK0_9ACTN
MSPAVKYTLGRLGLFVLFFALLLPLPLNILIKAMVALLLSAVLSYFLLADWRNKMGEQLADAASRRTAEKQRLRAALAGDEGAAAQGDRAALADRPVAESDRPAEPVAASDRVAEPAAETDRAADLAATEKAAPEAAKQAETSKKRV